MDKQTLRSWQHAISRKGQKNISEFLSLIWTFDHVEIIDVKERVSDLASEHIKLLDARLQKVEVGKLSYQKWDVVKNIKTKPYGVEITQESEAGFDKSYDYYENV